MCSSGSNTKTTQQTSTTSANPQALAAYQDILGQAQQVSQAPWNPATAQQVAGFTNPQQTAFGAIDGGISQPYIDEAHGYAQVGSAPITGQTIQNYQNPWTQQVVDSVSHDFDVQNQRQQSGVVGNARIAGSLGGDREAVAQALTAEAQNRTQDPILAGLRSQGFNTALSAAQTDASRSLQGAGVTAGLGQAAYTDTNARLMSGGLQQQQNQKVLDAASGNAAAQSAYPFQTLQWLAGLSVPVGGAMGQTTTGNSVTQGPQPNTWSQALGAGIAALPYLSKLATGGRVSDFAAGGTVPYSGGYVPSMSMPAGGGGIHAPTMSGNADMPQQKSLADHMRDVTDSAKVMRDGMQGAEKIGSGISDWMRTSQGPGGWSTTVDYGNPGQNLSYGLSNTFGFAGGGSVRGYAEGGVPQIVDDARSSPFFRTPDTSPPPQSAPPALAPMQDVPVRDDGGFGDAYAPPPVSGEIGSVTDLNPRGGINTPPRPTASAAPPPQAQPGLGTRAWNWLQTDEAANMLGNVGAKMMAASAVGGKGTTGVHLGEGLQAGLAAQSEFQKQQRDTELKRREAELHDRAQMLREGEHRLHVAKSPYEIALLEAQAKAHNATASAKEDPSLAYAIRKREADRIGLSPNSDEYREFILTGKMQKHEPSPTAQKQIIESQEAMTNAEITKGYIDQALTLNSKAWDGATAQQRSWLMSQLPEGLRPSGTMETRELSRIMMQQVLGNLKATFGGNPTEGERKILVDTEAAINATAQEREGILRRAKEALERRAAMHRDMMQSLRGGTMFKPQDAPAGGISTPASAAPRQNDPLGIRP